MLTMANKGGRGAGEMLTMADKGGRGSGPPFLADIICEQSLIYKLGKNIINLLRFLQSVNSWSTAS